MQKEILAKKRAWNEQMPLYEGERKYLFIFFIGGLFLFLVFSFMFLQDLFLFSFFFFFFCFRNFDTVDKMYV